MRRIIFCTFLIFSAFCHISFAEVQWEPDVRLTVNGNSAIPSIAVDPQGRVHVVWVDKRDGNGEVYYKRSLDGGKSWGPDVRLTVNSSYSSVSSIAVDSNNGVHVLWSEHSNFGFWYKRSKDGGNTWEEAVPLMPYAYALTPAAIATDSQDRIHVVWEDLRNEESDVYYKRSLDGGQTWTEDVRLTAHVADAILDFVTISADSQNRVHVGWDEYDLATTKVYYKHSLNGGATWDTDVQVIGSESSQFPLITTDLEGGVHVAYTHNLDSYYRHSFDGGNSWGNEKRLSNSQSAYTSVVTTDSHGSVHVIWNDYLDGQIYYRWSPDNGNYWEAEIPLTTNAVSSWHPRVVSDSMDRLHVVWNDYRDGNEEVYYKRGIQGCGHSSIRPIAALSSAQEEEDIDALPNFDVRAPTSSATAVKPSASRIQEFEDLKARWGEMLRVTWNPLNGTPDSIHNFKDGYLSEPSSEPPLTIALAFFKEHEDLFGLSEKDFEDFEDEGSTQTKRSGTTHVHLSQIYQGIPIFGAQMTINVGKEGRVRSWGGAYFPGINISVLPKLSATEALIKAARDVAPDVSFQPEIISEDRGPTKLTVFQKGPFNKTDGFHAAGLTVFPMREESRLAWQVLLHKNSLERYMFLIDANTGEFLYRTNLVNFAQPQGLVFEEDPDDAPQVLMSFEGDPGASPDGWLYQNQGVYSTLGGNNTCTQEDRNYDNMPGYSPSATDGHFEYPFQNAYETSGGTDVDTDLDAALANLFYQVNLIHDYFYSLGFDEAAGNFQSNNFGKGGLGNDEVQADGQDSWDNTWDPHKRNNANFYTPPDGGDPVCGKPRMQMYLFTKPPLRDADGNFDGKVIVHEYTHGLSTRLVGGPTASSSRGGCFYNNPPLAGIQSGAMGEGWGDWFASSIYNDPVVGEYVSGNPQKGIREYPLDDSPLTYGNLCKGPYGCEVHFDGEIWSATLGDLRKQFINKYGYNSGKEQVEQLVVEGMESAAADPSMLDMRDDILAADTDVGGANQDIIWQAFACRGMGNSSFTIDHNDQNPIEAFDIPGGGDCASPYTADLSLDLLDSPDPVQVNELLTYSATVTNNGPDHAWDVKFSDILPSNVAFVSALPSQGACVGTSTVTCDLGKIEKNNSATVTIIVKPTLAGSIVNMASITGWVDDSNLSNNSASVTTTVTGKSCLGTGTFRLGGLVRDASGNGIRGVTMMLNGPDNCTDITTTVPRGYAFRDLGTGDYTVTPTKANCEFVPTSRTVTVNKRNNPSSFRGTCAE